MEFLRSNLPVGSTMPLTDINYKAKLDQNESPFDLPHDVKSKILEDMREFEFNRYPQPSFYMETKEIFSQFINVPPRNFAITVGADQGIWLSFFLAGGVGKKAVIYEPTYPIFKHAAKLTQTEYETIVLGENYTINPETFGNFDIITIVNPNNPTGNLQDDEVVLNALETGKFVALDEAYFNFSKRTFANYINDYPNLFIIRSLSKSLLAGWRVGYVIAHEKVISIVEEILTAPYHLTTFQLILLRKFDIIEPILKETVIHVKNEKERIYKTFESLNVEYFKSYANFVLFKVDKPDRVYDELLKRGIRIRNTSKMPGLDKHLRITVGSKEENDEFIKALGDILP